MAKKSVATTPWEVTAEMFLSESETDSLLKYVRERSGVDGESALHGDEATLPVTTTADDSARLRSAVDRLIVELLLFSGLRNSELCHLRVTDTFVGHGKSAVQVTGTPKQDRTVFVPQWLSSELARFVNEIRPRYVPKGVSPIDRSQPLILNDRGRPYDRTALYRRVVRILTEAGLEDRASVQLLRHTYGYLAYKRTNGNLLFVQQQLGHSHPMVTAVYSQFVQFSYEELADRVGHTNQSIEPMETNPQTKKPRKTSQRKTKGAK